MSDLMLFLAAWAGPAMLLIYLVSVIAGDPRTMELQF
jgi:hypothetical protein